MKNQDDYVRQDTRVLEYLLKCGPRGATMSEMRKTTWLLRYTLLHGYDIHTSRVSETDEHGILHHGVSRYFLVGTKSKQLNLFGE